MDFLNSELPTSYVLSHGAQFHYVYPNGNYRFAALQWSNESVMWYLKRAQGQMDIPCFLLKLTIAIGSTLIYLYWKFLVLQSWWIVLTPLFRLSCSYLFDWIWICVLVDTAVADCYGGQCCSICTVPETECCEFGILLSTIPAMFLVVSSFISAFYNTSPEENPQRVSSSKLATFIYPKKLG